MKKEFSFIIGEGKDRLSCSDEFDKQKRRVIESEIGCEFMGEPQFFEPTTDGEEWFAYQQYTYVDNEESKIISKSLQRVVAKDMVIGTGKNFFLCCCDLNNRIRLVRFVMKNVIIKGTPVFSRPTTDEKLWKASQLYTYEPQKY